MYSTFVFRLVQDRCSKSHRAQIRTQSHDRSSVAVFRCTEVHLLRMLELTSLIRDAKVAFRGGSRADEYCVLSNYPNERRGTRLEGMLE